MIKSFSRLLAGSSALLMFLAVPAAAQTEHGWSWWIAFSWVLRDAVTVEAIRGHQQALQDIATANNGTRTSGSPGYDASLRYVERKLRDSGYQVTVQPFQFPFFHENSPSELARLAPDPRSYVNGTDFVTFRYSGSGTVEGVVVPTNDIVIPPTSEPSSTSGCEAADFPSVPAAPAIALVQRGTCTFGQKAANAKAAGYKAIIVFNEGQEGRQEVLNGTLGEPVDIPAVGTTFSLGEQLYGLARSGEVRVRIKTDTRSEIRTTANVIGETAGGRADRVVVVGAHLDSVPEGPGINDNGSGTATILEIAHQLNQLCIIPQLCVVPLNKVRFAFWGAEESGLLGSQHYVSQLTPAELGNIMLNLNFDMVGSPNYVRFVYDGDGSDTGTAGPNGSAQIEDVFLDYFGSQNLATVPTAFDGRSDYGPFITAGIPAGGLFSGAEGIKTAEQAEIFGGIADLAYDRCYHQACDNFDNNNDQALEELGDAAAHAVLQFSMTASPVKGISMARDGAVMRVPDEELAYRGADLQR